MQARALQPMSFSMEEKVLFTWWHVKVLSTLIYVKYYLSLGEGKGQFGSWDAWLCFANLWTTQQNPLVICSKLQALHCNYFSFWKTQKVKHSTGLPFKGWLVLSVLNAPMPLKKCCFVLLKNNRSYGITLNSTNVGNVGRKDIGAFQSSGMKKKILNKTI